MDNNGNYNYDEEQQKQRPSLLDRGQQAYDDINRIKDTISNGKNALSGQAGTAAAGTAGTGAATTAAGATAAETAAASTAAASATATGTAAAGATAATGTAAAGTAAAGGATAAGGAALGTVGIVALIVVVVIFLLIIVVMVYNNVVSTQSLYNGADEESLVTSKEYGNLSLTELNEALKKNNICEGTTIWQKLGNLIEDSTDDIDSVCEGIRYIKNTTEKYEKRFTNFKLSPGLLLTTLIYSYSSGDIEKDDDKKEIVDASSPIDILENIFKNRFITKEKLKELIEYMMYNEHYKYYIWDIVREEEYFDEKGNLDYVIDYWGCKEEPYEDHYMSYDKYFMYMRYGVNKKGFDYAGKTTVKNIGTIIEEIEYAESGYEWEQNQIYRWLKTPEYCKTNKLPLPKLASNTKSIKNKIDEKSIKKARDEYEDYDKTNETEIYRYLQSADYKNVANEDTLLPVYSSEGSSMPGWFELDYYRNGFIYKFFRNFDEEHHKPDDKFDPKDAELALSMIDDHEEVMNEILGVKVTNIPGKGIDGGVGGGTPVFGNDLIANARQFLGWTRPDFIAAGFNPSEAWCAWFTGLIISQTPSANSVINYSSNGVDGWVAYFASRSGDNKLPEFYHSASFINYGYTYKGGAYIPKTGDLIFFVSTGYYHGDPFRLPAPSGNINRHVGIVVSTDGKTVTYISGNTNDSSCPNTTCVGEDTYSLTDTWIIGYGVWE